MDSGIFRALWDQSLVNTKGCCIYIKKKVTENKNQNYNEISPHTDQNGHYYKIYKQLTLERVWRKRNPLALLVGM